MKSRFGFFHSWLPSTKIKREATTTQHEAQAQPSALRASMGASDSKGRSPSPSPPAFALKRRCSSGAAQELMSKGGGGCCVFQGNVGGKGSAVRVKSAHDDPTGGVFDPSRSHPTVALLISDLKGGGGRSPHPVHLAAYRHRRGASPFLLSSLLHLHVKNVKYPREKMHSCKRKRSGAARGGGGP